CGRPRCGRRSKPWCRSARRREADTLFPLSRRYLDPRMAALSEPAWPTFLRARAAARVARHLRHRVPLRARRLDHPALRDLHPIFDLHRTGPDRDDPDVQRYVELAVDGL